MTTETGCRVSVDELKHDRDGEAFQKRRAVAYVVANGEFWDRLTAGEVGEAVADCPSDEVAGALIAAIQAADFSGIGAAVYAMTGHWVMTQANKEVDRMIERGEV